jgi:glutamine synthetase
VSVSATDEPGRLDLEELRSAASAGEIHTVVTAFPDVYGRLVGKRIHARFFLDEIAEGGMHVCDYLLACDMEMDPTPGYAFTSWKSGYGDLHAVPDLSSLRRADWLDGTAWVLCDLFDEETGEPIPVAPRNILRRQVERARALGFEPVMASELEFYLFRETYEAGREREFRDLRPTAPYIEDYHVLSGAFCEDVIGAIRHHVDASGVAVEFSKGEWGPGQHEINLRYAPALEMADRHVLYKQAAKEIAAARGASLTFMAKLDEKLAGSSLHVHSSLWTPAGEAAFAGDTPLHASLAATGSETFRRYLAGQLAHAPELAFFFAPNANSYKRYQEGSFAPTVVAWSWDNRTAGFRVVGRGSSLRAECRIPGADANPYLVYAALLAAGLDGIERELDPGPPCPGNVYEVKGLPRVPDNLRDSLDALAESDFARRTFGDVVIDHLLHFGRTELRTYEAAVTDWERVRFFERI